jgi:hypothetical protein
MYPKNTQNIPIIAIIIAIILCLTLAIALSNVDFFREGMTNAQVISGLEQAKEQEKANTAIDLNANYYDPVQQKYVARDPSSQLLYPTKTPAPNVKYDRDNLGVSYHADLSAIIHQSDDTSNAGVGYMWVKGADGKLVSMEYKDVSNTTLYYDPKEYKTMQNYVPGYSEYVKLSRFSKSRINPTAVYTAGFPPPDELNLRPNLPDLPSVPAYTWESIWQKRIPESSLPYKYGLLT